MQQALTTSNISSCSETIRRRLSGANPVTAANLPADVLAEILWFCFDPSYASVTSATAIRSLSDIAPRPYLGVCRQWRDVAHYACKLWAQWEIFIITGGHSSLDEEKMFKAVNSFVKDSLSKSGDANIYFRLRVAIGSRVQVYSAQLAALVGLLLGCQSRWERASIEFYPPNLDGSVPLSLSPYQFHRLRDLSLAGDWHLKDLLASGTGRISFPTLNSLSLSRTSLKSCKIWLSICPNLTTFVGHIDFGDDVDIGHFYSASLRAMELEWSHNFNRVERFEILASLFDSLTCRALERLGIARLELEGDDSGGGFERSFERFMERNQHRLATLSIHHIDSVVLLPSLQSLSCISTLHVCCADKGSPVLRFLTSVNVCPALASVSIAGVASSNDNYIAFITSRWNSVPRKLQTVRFVGCYSLLDTSADGTNQSIRHELANGFPVGWALVEACVKGGLDLECFPLSFCRNVVHG